MAANEVNFTKPRLDALEPRAARYEVRDTTVKGLVLRVSPTGVKSFAVFAWVPAKRRPERLTLGKHPDLSIDVARKRAKKLLGQIAEGKSPAAEKRAYHAEDTLEQVFERYMREHVRAKLGRKTAVDMQGTFDNHIAPSRLHQRKLGDVKLADIESLHRRIGKDHPRAANKVLELVRAVYRYANKHDAKVANPVEGVTWYAHGQRERFLQPDEMPRFLAALDATPQPHQDLFRLLLLTGVRLGNMLAARFDQFDLTHGIWSIPGPQHKNKKPVALPLLPEAVEIVRRRREAVPKGEPWLWPSTASKSGHITTIRTEWAALLERADIASLWRHDIRRTVGSWMAINGASLKLIGAALGHTSVQATQVYARLTLDPVREQVSKAWGNMLAAGDAKRT